MVLKATLTGFQGFARAMKAERARWQAAVVEGVKGQTRATQLDVRRQVQGAFGGNRKAGNAVRQKVFDDRNRGGGAAGLIYSKFGRKESGKFVDYVAPRLFGGEARPKRGSKFLVLPIRAGGTTRAARRRLERAQASGKLDFVPIKGGSMGLLVRRFKKKSTPLAILIRRVRYARRTSPAALLRPAARQVAGRVLRAYRRRKPAGRR